MKTKLLILIILLLPLINFAQDCVSLMKPVSLSERVSESSLIIEGKILNSKSYWDANQRHIYTVHEVTVYKSLKGNAASTVNVVTQGGRVGTIVQTVSNASQLQINDEGTFMLKPFSSSVLSSVNGFELVAAAQGVIKYNPFTNRGSDLFTTYNSITNDVYNSIQQLTGSGYTELQARPIFSNNNKSSSNSPILYSFSPLTATAGTQTQFTITGNNFGTTQGSIGFSNANDGGASYTYALDSQIISWSNTDIVVEIPSTAGTGFINIVTDSGANEESTVPLTIEYAQLNPGDGTTAYPAALYDQDGNGGLSFVYHTGFDGSTAATYFEAAFEQWNCESQLNFTFSGTTTTNATGNDGENIVQFDNGSLLSTGALGVVVNTYNVCSATNKAIPIDMDIVWDNTTNWYYGSGNPGATEYDFKSVALHEMGHAHQLGHVIDDDLIMHYSLGNGVNKYVLDQLDIDGANYIMTVSSASVGCGLSAMTGQNYCCDDITITTQPSVPDVCDTEVFTISADGTDYSSLQWQVNDGNGWTDLSNDSVYSNVTTTTLGVIADTSMDDYMYRLAFGNTCNEVAYSNEVTANIDTLPIASITTGSTACSGTITFAFSEDPNRTNLEFSLDNGSTYPYNYADTTSPQTISDIGVGDYTIWVRWGDDDCPIELGDYTVSLDDSGCYTSIPDANFEAALEALGYDDISGDNQVPTANIETITSLDVSYKSISDLTGIEDFTSLLELDIRNNNLSTVDISNNVLLTSFKVQNNNLTSIDVSNNTDITFLNITNNAVTSLDVSNNTLLSELYTAGNAITSADLSNNPNLTIVGLNPNNLSSLNIQNGNNTAITTFAANGNPNLTCVLVDDAAYSTANWTIIDAQTSFNDTVCYSEYTSIPDANFEAELEAQGYDDISGDGQVPTALIENVTTLAFGENLILDLTGIEDFTSLTTLDLYQIALPSIDLSNNTSLQVLRLYENPLTELDVSMLTNLTELNVLGTDIISLDVSSNTALTFIDASQNDSLTTLNVKNGNNSNFSLFSTLETSNLTCVLVDDADYSTTNWTNIDAQTSFNDIGCFSEYTAIPDANFEAELEAQGYDDITGDGQVPTALIETVTYLNISNKNISDITGIEDFTALDDFYVNGNNLTTIDVSSNTALKFLFCNDNNLTTLNVSSNSLLEVVFCDNNQLTALDISNNALLNQVDVSNNPLSALDVSTNTALTELQAKYTNLTTLDLTNNSLLNEVDISNSTLTDLDLRNGNNETISDLVLTDNPNLTCVLVDDAAYATSNFTDIDTGTTFSDTYCQYTAIPDANFEAALESFGYDDISGDNQVPTALINTVTSLDIDDNAIADLTGIEDFTALESLRAGNNLLSQLDIANLSNLNNLELEYNQLTTLDVSSNPLLEVLNVSHNNITTLDISNNILLSTLLLHSNEITELDLSAHINLVELNADDNNLSVLNIKNGNNANVTQFTALNNPNLTCVLVDDANYSTTNWTNIDAQTSFSDTYCSYTAIPDANFEAALEALGYDDISGDGQVPTALIEVVTSLSIANSNIADLTGIEDFTALQSLRANNNDLTEINTSTLTNLQTLWFNGNDVNEVDLTNNTLLSDLRFEYNNLTELNTDALINLSKVYAQHNQINALDLSNNTMLSQLFFSYNNLVSLDLTNNSALTQLNVTGNDLEFLDVRNGNNTSITQFKVQLNNLDCILVDDAAYATSNFTVIDAGTIFSETYCRYTSIPDANFEAALETLGYDDISSDGQVPTALIENITNLNIGSSGIEDLTGIQDFTGLYTLLANNNNLTTVDVSSLVKLISLSFRATNISTLDVSTLTNLEILEVHNNNIATLDLSNNAALTFLNVRNNNLTSLDISHLTQLETLKCRYNSIVSLDLSNASVLEELDCDNNALTNLNLKNGNNGIITSIDATSNPNLTCVLVDDETYSNTNWNTFFDATSNFSDTYCRYTAIPDANFETALENLGYDDISNDGQVPTSLIENITTLDISLQNIQDLTGIEDFVALTDFNAFFNGLTTIDLSQNTALETLELSNNFFDALDVSNNTNLKSLTCAPCGLDALDITNNLLLETIDVGDNALTSFDVSNNTSLISLIIDDNTLTAIDLSHNLILEYLKVDDNQLTTIDLSNNSALLFLLSSFNNLTSVDVSNNVFLEEIDLQGNSITSIDFSNNPELNFIYLTNNNITQIDLSNQSKLEELYVEYNPITDLDLSNNPLLIYFYAFDCAVENLNLASGGNTNIQGIGLTNNPNLACVLVDDASYSTTNWTDIDAQTSFSETLCTTDYTLAIKVFLQGALLNPNTGEETLMRDDLRVAGLLPTTSPYGTETCDSTVFDVTGSDAIVDWVWIELRDTVDQTVISASRSALLQRDGDVVDVDGTSHLTFSLEQDAYYVAIKHRNHLGVMHDTSPLFFSDATTTIDFTDANNQITYGTNAQTTFGMPSGVAAMWAGDANGDGRLNYSGALSDVPGIRSQVFNDPDNSVFGGPPVASYPSQGYNGTDVNMDGVTVYSGASSDVLYVRNNTFNNPSNSVFGGPPTSTYVFIQQLPEGAN